MKFFRLLAIGSLVSASVFIVRANTQIAVSGGDFASPFYTFHESGGAVVDIINFNLSKGETYVFTDDGVSASHPFMIGESYGDTSSPLVTGTELSGSVGSTITVSIPSDFTGELFYFCTLHTSMVQKFNIVDGGDSGDIGAGTSNEFTLDTTDTGSGGFLGIGESNEFALDTTDTGSGGFLGIGESNEFALDTTDTGSGGFLGIGESNEFALDTTDTGSGGFLGIGESNEFALDTTDTGSGGFLGIGESNEFALDTTDTGSGGFLGIGESNEFALDTTDTGSGGFLGIGESNEFALDTTDGNSAESGVATVSGVVSYDGVVPGVAYVWALEANGSKAAEKILSEGNGSYTLTVTVGKAYDFKAFVDGTGDGYPQGFETWKHYGEWNSSLGGFNLTQVDGNLTGVDFNLFDYDNDNDGFLNWHEHLAGTDENNASSRPNTAPQFQSDGNLSGTENQAFIFDFNATDVDGDTLTYSILYGDDAHLFELIPSTGLLAFKSLPDFENPVDKNADNHYEATIQVSDGKDNTILNVKVAVKDESETPSNSAPQFQSDGNLSGTENQAFIFDFNATDVDGDTLTYSILYGDDAHLFELIPSTGLLAFKSLPDFENPTDKNADNHYEATIQVSDGKDNTILNVKVEVLNLVEDDQGDPTDPADNLVEIVTSSVRAKVDKDLVISLKVEGSLDLLVRGHGPVLSQYALSNVMSDPQISLVDHYGTVIAFNDDWQSASNSSEISLNNQAPGDPKEPAVLLTLSEGTYTIILNSKDGGGGIAMLELINLDPAKQGKIKSLSVRGEVDSVEPMIHYLSLQGSNEMSLLSLLRGEDSIASLGVPDGLPNPRQKITFATDEFGPSTMLSENDDWDTHPQSFLLRNTRTQRLDQKIRG